MKKRGHDFASTALRVVEQAIGEHMDGSPLERDAGKNQAAIDRSRRGGLKGGKARAEKLSPEKRHEVAEKAARTRWSKKQ